MKRPRSYEIMWFSLLTSATLISRALDCSASPLMSIPYSELSPEGVDVDLSRPGVQRSISFLLTNESTVASANNMIEFVFPAGGSAGVYSVQKEFGTASFSTTVLESSTILDFTTPLQPSSFDPNREIGVNVFFDQSPNGVTTSTATADTYDSLYLGGAPFNSVSVTVPVAQPDDGVVSGSTKAATCELSWAYDTDGSGHITSGVITIRNVGSTSLQSFTFRSIATVTTPSPNWVVQALSYDVPLQAVYATDGELLLPNEEITLNLAIAPGTADLALDWLLAYDTAPTPVPLELRALLPIQAIPEPVSVGLFLLLPLVASRPRCGRAVMTSSALS